MGDTRVGNRLRGPPAAVLLALTLILTLALASGAEARIYWANSGSGTIGSANLDGSGVDQSFVSARSDPRGVAVDGAHLYWGNVPQEFQCNETECQFGIGRANLDGSGVDNDFITGLGGPVAIAVDGAHIYSTATASNRIGRANLNGSGADQSFISGASGPVEVAVDAVHIYWTNTLTSTIGRANLDGSGVDRGFISGASRPSGIAVDGPTIAELIGEVEELGLPHGIERGLLAKPGGAQRKVDADRLTRACGKLGAFANEVRAQTGKRIDGAEAAELVSQLSTVRASLGCRRP
jgi:Low-density lipoprotein receptor repeat class B